MEAWEQQAGEPGAAYAAFNTYLGQGPARTLDGAYRQAQPGHKQGARAPGNWRTWHKAHAWVERAAAWDRRNVQVADQAKVAAVAAHATDETKAWLDQLNTRQLATEKYEWDVAQRLFKKALAMLDFGLAEVVRKTGPHGETIEIYTPTDWNMGDAARLVKVATQLARQANQMPLRVAEAPPQDAADAMFDTRGQLADQLPPGVVPPMPTDPDAKPDLGNSLLTDNPHDLTQPGEPPRPTK